MRADGGRETRQLAQSGSKTIPEKIINRDLGGFERRRVTTPRRVNEVLLLPSKKIVYDRRILLHGQAYVGALDPSVAFYRKGFTQPTSAKSNRKFRRIFYGRSA